MQSIGTIFWTVKYTKLSDLQNLNIFRDPITEVVLPISASCKPVPLGRNTIPCLPAALGKKFLK